MLRWWFSSHGRSRIPQRIIPKKTNPRTFVSNVVVFQILVGSIYSTPTMENWNFTPAPPCVNGCSSLQKNGHKRCKQTKTTGHFHALFVVGLIGQIYWGKKNFHLGGEIEKSKKKRVKTAYFRWIALQCIFLSSNFASTSIHFLIKMWRGVAETSIPFFWRLTCKWKSVSQANLFKEWNTCF